MTEPTPEKKAEWRQRAAAKGGIVPHFFEVFPQKVELQCGGCRHSFKRPLLFNQNEPLIACPNCTAKNWVPVTFDLKN
jgi:hypothetical protein